MGDKRNADLYQAKCSSCHIAPSPEDLPKQIWEEKVLPEMGARMGYYHNGYDPYKDMSWKEKTYLQQTTFYPQQPAVTPSEWKKIMKYVIDLAPDTLPSIEWEKPLGDISQFGVKKYSIDHRNEGMVTFIGKAKSEQGILVGNGYGELWNWPGDSSEVSRKIRTPTSIVSYLEDDSSTYLLEIGQMTPTEISSGSLYLLEDGKKNLIKNQLHRPVYLQACDINSDGEKELFICEFGHYSGQLTMLVADGKGKYQPTQLANVPGIMKIDFYDMDHNGLIDIILMSAQGDEGIDILYQQEPMEFEKERILRFNPAYGSSWFELIDYDDDGDQDIITVNGDNADYSYCIKPYHGLRIFINDGRNRFEEKFFQALPGATRVVASDFDQDSDIDIAVTCFFPDYQRNPKASFVYFENNNEASFDFTMQSIPESIDGRWLIMESFDYDNDQDKDIILGSFTYALTPIPQEISGRWKNQNTDIIILKNLLTE